MPKMQNSNSPQDVYFSEVQKFRQWWVWLLIIGTTGLSIGLIIYGLLSSDSDANENLLGGIICGIIAAPLDWLFLSMRLETQITRRGIDVQFFPFNFSPRHYSWDRISNVYVRKYGALREFGGYGLRIGIRGDALNISGDMGIQIEFDRDRKLLIGTNDSAGVESALMRLGKTQ
jgi:hypothetical protein